jgi:hypothetical protein
MNHRPAPSAIPVLPTYPVWSTTMPVITRSPRSGPHSAPASYLARPASVRISAVRRRPPGRPAGSGETFSSGRRTR